MPVGREDRMGERSREERAAGEGGLQRGGLYRVGARCFPVGAAHDGPRALSSLCQR